MRRAVVIGAGIGGLTTALALTARGWKVTVLERAPQQRPVGYALLIAPNALRALDTLPGGIAHEVVGLARSTEVRRPRATMIVRRSEQIARFATTSNRVGVALRNTLLRASGPFGPSAALRQADFVMRWDHPAVRRSTL